MLNKYGEPVVQLTLEGEFIREFTSAAEVKRLLGYEDSLIRSCCKGGMINSNNGKYYPLYKAYGFKWKYKKDYNHETSKV